MKNLYKVSLDLNKLCTNDSTQAAVLALGSGLVN